MKSSRSIAGAAAIVLACVAATASAGDRIVLREGMKCRSEQDARHEGETHACYFLPGKAGRHDFSTRNARGGQVITELGPSCKEIEILGEDDFQQQGEGGHLLKRVSVLCVG